VASGWQDVFPNRNSKLTIVQSWCDHEPKQAGLTYDDDGGFPDQDGAYDDSAVSEYNSLTSQYNLVKWALPSFVPVCTRLCSTWGSNPNNLQYQRTTLSFTFLV
jgi:hypothetical protein